MQEGKVHTFYSLFFILCRDLHIKDLCIGGLISKVYASKFYLLEFTHLICYQKLKSNLSYLPPSIFYSRIWQYFFLLNCILSPFFQDLSRAWISSYLKNYQLLTIKLFLLFRYCCWGFYHPFNKKRLPTTFVWTIHIFIWL